MNSETISCQSKPKRGKFISKIFFLFGRQKTSRPEQKKNGRTAVDRIHRKGCNEDDEKKEKTKTEREKRKTSDTCVEKVIDTVARYTGFNHGRLKAEIPALKQKRQTQTGC